MLLFQRSICGRYISGMSSLDNTKYFVIIGLFSSHWYCFHQDNCRTCFILLSYPLNTLQLTVNYFLMILGIPFPEICWSPLLKQTCPPLFVVSLSLLLSISPSLSAIESPFYLRNKILAVMAEAKKTQDVDEDWGWTSWAKIVPLDTPASPSFILFIGAANHLPWPVVWNALVR